MVFNLNSNRKNMPQFDIVALLPTTGFIAFIMVFSFLYFCEFFFNPFIIKNKLKQRFFYQMLIVPTFFMRRIYKLKNTIVNKVR
jgi:RsiW-degrading membrane proteinase PrsW (M82 family)